MANVGFLMLSVNDDAACGFSLAYNDDYVR